MVDGGEQSPDRRCAILTHSPHDPWSGLLRRRSCLRSGRVLRGGEPATSRRADCERGAMPRMIGAEAASICRRRAARHRCTPSSSIGRAGCWPAACAAWAPPGKMIRAHPERGRVGFRRRSRHQEWRRVVIYWNEVTVVLPVSTMLSEQKVEQRTSRIERIAGEIATAEVPEPRTGRFQANAICWCWSCVRATALAPPSTRASLIR